MSTPTPAPFADPIDLQNRLFARLSTMFGGEVPLYDKSLAVNKACNTAVCDMLGRMFKGFSVSEEELDRASGERHGAIRIGREDEYRWITRFFACFGMEPHNFYDMTSVGAKSQPVIATAFRSRVGPEHRVFSSLLRTDYFDGETRERIEARLSKRTVFSDKAKALIEKREQDGGLSEADAETLIDEATQRIFKWTGRAHDHGLYKHLCDGGFKIAADIACFERHHLNHLTPNTLCMDLYTSAMKFCLGEIDSTAFTLRAERAMNALRLQADRDWMHLHFKHLPAERLDAFERGEVTEADVAKLVETLTGRLGEADLQLAKLNHSGFKDFTEGPDAATPVLLRQDAYKALTEKVTFVEDDGTELETVHTARFGEIEQRFYAVTPAGRAMYDQCLAAFEEARAKDPDLCKRDPVAYESLQAECFAAFPKTLTELTERGLAYARYRPTEAGLAQNGSIGTTDIHELVAQGYADRDGLRYEDFLPVSAAGIFASNLSQYGTASTATTKPEYTAELLEQIMGRSIIDTDRAYAGMQASSLLETYERLGLLEDLSPARRVELESAVAKAAGGEAVTAGHG